MTMNESLSTDIAKLKTEIQELKIDLKHKNNMIDFLKERLDKLGNNKYFSDSQCQTDDFSTTNVTQSTQTDTTIEITEEPINTRHNQAEENVKFYQRTANANKHQENRKKKTDSRHSENKKENH